MSPSSRDEHGWSTGLHLGNTASTSLTAFGQTLPLPPDLKNTAGRPNSPTQATTLPLINEPTDFATPKPAGIKSTRVYVRRDRKRMKCARCMMHKRGCDGGPPQCENCQKSKKTCEWVEPGITRKALESQIAGGTICSPGRRHNIMTLRGLNKGQRANSQTSLPHDEYEDNLLKIQLEMEDADEEDNLGGDQKGTLFDETTKMYEDYKLSQGSIADRWARDSNSKLLLNWREHATELSHYSHGDCGGLGFTSTMEKNLGMEFSNQKYQAHKQPVFTLSESIPTQDWEVFGISPIGDFHRVAKPGADLSQTLTADALYGSEGLTDCGEVDFNFEHGVSAIGVGGGAGAAAGVGLGLGGHSESFGQACPQADMTSTPAHIHWSDWVNEDYDEEGYFHFTTLCKPE